MNIQKNIGIVFLAAMMAFAMPQAPIKAVNPKALNYGAYGVYVASTVTLMWYCIKNGNTVGSKKVVISSALAQFFLSHGLMWYDGISLWDVDFKFSNERYWTDTKASLALTALELAILGGLILKNRIKNRNSSSNN